jgi:hypothetical protein
MKFKMFLFLFSASMWIACNGNSSSKDSSESQPIEIQKEVMENDSITNVLNEKIEHIEDASNKLDELLKDIN